MPPGALQSALDLAEPDQVLFPFLIDPLPGLFDRHARHHILGIRYVSSQMRHKVLLFPKLSPWYYSPGLLLEGLLSAGWS